MAGELLPSSEHVFQLAAPSAEVAAPASSTASSPSGASSAPVGPVAGWQSWLGGQLSLESVPREVGVTLGAALFFELAPADARWSTRLSLRRIDQDRYAVSRPNLLLQAARWEGCWVCASWGGLSLTPCAGVEGGAIWADSDLRGPWVSASSHLRLSWAVSLRLALQVEWGLDLPFLHYDDELRRHGTLIDHSTPGASTVFGLAIHL